MTLSLSFSCCSPFMSLCTCPDTPNPFIGSMFFVLPMHLPVLYKYWPLPTYIFSNLVIVSLLLVTSVLSRNPKNSLLFQARTSALITPWSLSLQAPADLQLIMTQLQLIIQLTGYIPEVILLHPKMSFKQLAHRFHLVMALIKDPKARPTCSTFGPLTLMHRLLEPSSLIQSNLS